MTQETRISVGLVVAGLVMMGMLFLAGCSTPPAGTGKGPCLALSPHFPERVHKQDHVDTKVGAYRRNTAYGAACPGMAAAAVENKR